jgi:hypothetical protein
MDICIMDNGLNKNPGKLSNDQKREWAQMLYTRFDVTQKEIALKVAADESTIRRWIMEGEWDKMRRSLLTSREDQLRHLYDILAAITMRVKESDELGDTKDADKIIKYTTAIKNLEADVSIGEMIETGMQFIRFVLQRDIETAKLISLQFDTFIKHRLKQG